MHFDPEAPILVTGHRGLVGSALVRQLTSRGHTNVLAVGREELDLRDQHSVLCWFREYQPRYVIHAAGKVGGILANKNAQADFLHDNILLHTSVLRAAMEENVEKLLYLGSSCIYPRDCPQPIREDYLLQGALEQTNYGYAIAKISGLLACQAYRDQFGCRFISAMPTNLYGPNDNFDPTTSHVLPALIQRFHRAREARQSTVTIWGSGAPRREFLHVDDLASACVFLMKHYDSPQPVNIGTGIDVTIRQLAEQLRSLIYPECELVFDTSKPDGTPRKLLDTSKINALGWMPEISLEAGLRSTYEWYLNSLPRDAQTLAAARSY
ncbi:MAG: GDP-L-fucose synthase family protein [Rubinisphaera brasiliensis]|uniref:GDP-L-fucose synthase family protein n=1 Tax=Rubinisphaera brasiliensis TaxID=119 RepID=UPI0039194210